MHPRRKSIIVQTSAAMALMVLMLASVVVNAAGPVITPTELLKKIESGKAPLILDVRSVREYRSGHVPQAINIPHKLLAERLGEIIDMKDREIVTYCELGPRAGYAERILKRAGFSKVRSLKGHMSAWRTKGRPVVVP